MFATHSGFIMVSGPELKSCRGILLSSSRDKDDRLSFSLRSTITITTEMIHRHVSSAYSKSHGGADLELDVESGSFDEW